jgi:hypothetical protein
MGEQITTMGVDQVAGGLEVAVITWVDGTAHPLMNGIVSGDLADHSVLVMAELYDVRRALVDHMPDQRRARDLCSNKPDVFALGSGGGHNAASLAESAYRRTTAVMEEVGVIDGAPRVLGIEPNDSGGIVVRGFVPASEGIYDVGWQAVISLKDPILVQRGDGDYIIESVGQIAAINLVRVAP